MRQTHHKNTTKDFLRCSQKILYKKRCNFSFPETLICYASPRKWNRYTIYPGTPLTCKHKNNSNLYKSHESKNKEYNFTTLVSMNSSIHNLLTRILEKKVLYDAKKPFPKRMAESFYAASRIELTYHSNAIEGNTLTLAETALVINEQANIS